MTKKEAVKRFTSNVLPYVRQVYEHRGKIDKPARREAWNNWTDAMCRTGEITYHQYENWTHPACCK